MRKVGRALRARLCAGVGRALRARQCPRWAVRSARGYAQGGPCAPRAAMLRVGRALRARLAEHVTPRPAPPPPAERPAHLGQRLHESEGLPLPLDVIVTRTP